MYVFYVLNTFSTPNSWSNFFCFPLLGETDNREEEEAVEMEVGRTIDCVEELSVKGEEDGVKRRRGRDFFFC